MIDAFRAAVGQRLGEEIGLLLVVAFEADAVARLDDGFEQVNDAVDRNFLAKTETRRPLEAASSALTQAVPNTIRRVSVHKNS